MRHVYTLSHPVSNFFSKTAGVILSAENTLLLAGNADSHSRKYAEASSISGARLRVRLL